MDGSKNRLANLITFLQFEVNNEERVALAVSGFGTTEKVNFKEDMRDRKRAQTTDTDVPTAAGLLTVRENKVVTCLFCGENHESSECFRARDLTYEDRQQCMKEKRGCFKCLKMCHTVKTCRYNQKCP